MAWDPSSSRSAKAPARGRTWPTYNQPGSPDLGQGQHLFAPSMIGLVLTDGNSEIRVVAHDPTFNVADGSQPDPDGQAST